MKKNRDVGEGKEEEYKSEEDEKGKHEAENDEENLPLNHIFCLSTSGKGIVEGKKRIPLRFDILPYPHYGKFTISPFHYMTDLPFNHFTIQFVYHFTISLYQFVYNTPFHLISFLTISTITCINIIFLQII